jgi:hypothetical protein
MNKQELNSALTNTWQNFVIGLLLTNIASKDLWSTLSQKVVHFDSPDGQWLQIDPGWIAEMLGNRQNWDGALGELEKSLKRALVREGHELILFYCKETRQEEAYKAMPWFQFARIIRNAVSHEHGGILSRWPNDLQEKGILSVSWRNRTLDVNLVGKEIQFSHKEALQLFSDQFDFAQNQLS